MHLRRTEVSVSAASQVSPTVLGELLFSPKIERTPQSVEFANWATDQTRAQNIGKTPTTAENA
jgi:hypothetical protein